MSLKKCENCGKELEPLIMILHERYCALNIRKCSFCQELILREEYDEHVKSKHTEINCEKCGKKIKGEDREKHLKTCSKQLVECKYCQLNVEKSEIREHEYICGGKTLTCDYCGENVPKMEYDLHLHYTCKIKLQFDELESAKNGKKQPNQNLNKKDNINEKLDEISKMLIEEESGNDDKNHNSKMSVKNSKNNNKIKYDDYIKQREKQKSKESQNKSKSNSNEKLENFEGDYVNDSVEINKLDFGDDIIPEGDSSKKNEQKTKEVSNDSEYSDDIDEVLNKKKNVNKKKKKARKKIDSDYDSDFLVNSNSNSDSEVNSNSNSKNKHKINKNNKNKPKRNKNTSKARK